MLVDDCVGREYDAPAVADDGSAAGAMLPPVDTDWRNLNGDVAVDGSWLPWRSASEDTLRLDTVIRLHE